MTLQELQQKILVLMQSKDNANLEIHFFAEDDYNTIDVKINKVEVEEGKIFLS